MPYEYGLMTGDLKEKEIVNILSARLESFFRKNPDYNVYRKYHLLKHKHTAGKPASPNAIRWDYSYEYNMFHKYFGVYITMYPNTSPDGRMKFNIPEVKWNLSINDLDFHIKTEVINEKNPEIPDMIDFLLDNLPFETILIQKYENFMERL
ncbi:MAG: hypothetical protein NC177_07000 [Ruminococcus flavefaciens]|nr:hypothetical protein [Ruminococcus flavefaciens]